jgi:hypothetical protein
VFVYLVTSPIPMDFRVFILQHSELLRWLYGWTVRVLVPAPFAPAIRLFGHAVREMLATPLPPSNAEALCSVFRERQRRRETPAPADPQLRSLSLAYVDGRAVLAAVQASVLPHRPLRGCGPGPRLRAAQVGAFP